ncbi:MAG: hypothetical protein ACT4N2_00750 [Hyphomicrobium sp.]
MRLRFALLPVAVAPLIVLLAGSSAADEAYICDGGRIVYVKYGELEHLKRTDACIAGYYGVTINVAPAAAAAAEKGLAMERAALEKLGRKDEGKSPGASGKGAQSVAGDRKPVRTAKALPAPAPNTDFRNVLIINAAPGEARVFRHER